MKAVTQDNRFAWQAFCILFGWGSWILVVQPAAEAQLISRLTEGLLCLIPFLIAFGVLIWSSWRSKLSRPIRVTFLVLLLSVSMKLTFDITEEVRAFNDLPVIGKNSAARPEIERFVNLAWLGSGFLLLYLMVRGFKQASQELEATLEELRTAQHHIIQRERLSALGEMASGVAHDLNNTLTPVITYSELLLKDSTLTDEQSRLCRCTLQSATDAVAVIKRLGDFYRGNSAETAYEPVDIKNVITQIPLLTRPKWRDEAQLAGRKVDVKLDIQDVPYVWGNAADIRTVLTNLVFNAVDAMPNGGQITIGLGQNEETVTIDVSDTGRGMTEEEIARCFDPFYSTKAENSGLGLSVCHGIMQQHSGSIEINCKRHHGTTVRISLPLSKTKKDKPSNEANVRDSYPAIRCLCIEDEPDVRGALSMLLEAFGAEVDSAEEGAAGLELLETIDYDLVFTDLGMNEMDGAQILSAIKQRKPTLPVIIVSGWPRDEVLQRFSTPDQPDEVLQKPVRARDVYRLFEVYSLSKTR